MKKIILKNCDVKEFISLIKRSAVMDSLLFITVKGSEYESVSYNKNVSALKVMTTNLEEYCTKFENECGDTTVKLEFSNAPKIITSLGLAGTENVDVTFYIEDNNYAKKLTISGTDINLTIPSAENLAMAFCEIPESKRYTAIEDTTNLQYKVGITDNEFKYLNQLFSLNKECTRVFFSIQDGVVSVSEIDSKDENVRYDVSNILENNDIHGFNDYEKLYSKKLNTDNFEAVGNSSEPYLRCFNKSYFSWIDGDKHYDIEFHSNKLKFISVDDKGAKSCVIFVNAIFI